MSKYFVTSKTTQEYPFTFQDLRARPPKKKSGFLIAMVACTSALCGGAAAFAFMATDGEPEAVQVASLEAGGAAAASAITAVTPEKPARTAEPEPAPAKAEPVIVEPVKVQTVKVEPAAVAVANAEIKEPAPLKTNNPRWADEPSPTFSPIKQSPGVEKLAAVLKDVDIAESEADVVALEEEMNPELTTAAIAYAPEEEEAEPVKPVRISAPSFATGDLKAARATKWVNMRAKNNKYAAKLLVVPQNAEIRADPACKHWCRVVYDGKLGYVYRTYIRFPGEATVAANKTTQPEEQKTEKKSGGLINKIKENFRPDP